MIKTFCTHEHLWKRCVFVLAEAFFFFFFEEFTATMRLSQFHLHIPPSCSASFPPPVSHFIPFIPLLYAQTFYCVSSHSKTVLRCPSCSSHRQTPPPWLPSTRRTQDTHGLDTILQSAPAGFASTSRSVCEINSIIS